MLKSRLLTINMRVLVRFCHNEKKESSMTETNMSYTPVPKKTQFGGVTVKYWNERAAVKRLRKSTSPIKNIHNVVDLLKNLQNMRNFPKTLPEFLNYLKRRSERKMLAQQSFQIEREKTLRPDLAATHFIINLGGSVKFMGKPDWIGYKDKKHFIPIAYTPGLFVEGIKADDSELIHEGLPNMRRLRYLTSLSLKNLKTINDWSMDWISKEYYLTLKHLDISGCVNVTYRGLSCFYRFECLETLNVEGIPDTVEFKLACLMLLDNMPDLDIKGINLVLPEKINFNEVKYVSGSGSEIQEVKP